MGTTQITDNSVTGAKIAMGSDAQGDIPFYNGTDYARLAPGTSGQFLKTNGAGANPVWADATGGGATLLGTITTTSGTSQGLTGLTLTGYTQLLLVFNGVQNTGGGNYQLNDGTSDLTITAAGSALYGQCIISLDNGYSIFGFQAGTTYSLSSGSVVAGRTHFSTSSTTVTVKSSGSAFIAGSVKVYGIA